MPNGYRAVMRWKPGLLAAVASLGLVLAVWVTTSTGAPSWRHPDVTRSPRRNPLTANPSPTAGRPGSGSAHQQPTNHTATTSVVLMTLALILIAVFLLAIVLGRRYVKKRREYATFDSFDPTVTIAAVEDVPEIPDVVTEGIEARLATLARGSPRNAIVACWLDLEEAARLGGLPRQPAETSTEFTARVLSTYAVDTAAIRRLAALYREARFSTHPLTESHRHAALVALEQLHADLRQQASGAVSVGGGA